MSKKLKGCLFHRLVPIFIACLLVLAIPQHASTAAETIIIDHLSTDIYAIPQEWIAKAKSDLHIAYGHTSHGSQITDGMSGLVNFMNGKGYPQDLYTWNNGGTGGALDLRENPFSGASDLGTPDRTSWATATRNYLNAHPDVNVIMWSWCGQVSSATTADIETYLNLMSALENDYPSVRFVYMTGHTDGTGLSGNLHLRNQQIRDYCEANNKILYDFEDIESYDPDGRYFGDKNVTYTCNYYIIVNNSVQSGNWATEWQNSHTEGVDWYQCDSAHSEPLNANLKAYAAWWLWVRIAGWDDDSLVNIPIANAGADQSASSGDLVFFDGSDSYDSDGTIISYEWDFGDNGSATGVHANHRFRGTPNNSETYTVTLTVVDDSGASGTDTANVTVRPLEKSVEINDPPVLAKATFTYNWIEQSSGDDIYMISKLDVEAEGFVGVFAPNIVVWEYQYPAGVISTIDFLDYLFAWGPHTEQIYRASFSLKSPIGIFSGDTKRTFDEGVFEGILIKGTDTINIFMQGVTLKEGWPSIDTKLFSFQSSAVDPHVGTVEPSLVQKILDKLLDVVTGKLDIVMIHSPGEFRIYDSQGHIAGLLNEEIKLEIPGSAYKDGTLLICPATDSYRYVVVGTEHGTYGLCITHATEDEALTFTATNIPISTSSVHQYTINWYAVARGEKGVTIQIDANGDGTFENTLNAGDELTHDDFVSATSKGESPFWIWIIIFVADVAVVGGGILLWRSFAKKPMALG